MHFIIFENASDYPSPPPHPDLHPHRSPSLQFLPLWPHPRLLWLRLLLWYRLLNRTLPVIQTITTACFNAQSNSYCPDPTFFARLGTGFLNAQGCFYYNSSSDILNEVTLTTSQVNTITNTQNNFTFLAVQIHTIQTASASTRPGYQIGDILTIGTNTTTFTFAQSNGDCLVTAATATTFQLKFGVNMKLSCNSAATGTPLLFS